MISALIIFFETFALAWLLHWLFSRRVHIEIRIVCNGDSLRRARKRGEAHCKHATASTMLVPSARTSENTASPLARSNAGPGSKSPGPVSDLQSALENLGAKKRTAQAAAEKVCAQYPRASFETLLRLALQNTP